MAVKYLGLAQDDLLWEKFCKNTGLPSQRGIIMLDTVGVVRSQSSDKGFKEEVALYLHR
jgi:hypothetical protein